MTPLFRVKVLNFSNILEIDGARTLDQYASLLEAMDYGDQTGMSDDDRHEMCLMSLQDLGPEEAAYMILKHDIGDVLRDGQIRNMAVEMLDEKLWEEYADSSLHERLFSVGSLLYTAFPQVFPKPDAVCIRLDVTATNAAAGALLTPSLNESFLVRLLADGMDDHAALYRLYDNELKGQSFPDADQIVWITRINTRIENSLELDVISSGYWLDALEHVDTYDSSAYADSRP